MNNRYSRKADFFIFLFFFIVTSIGLLFKSLITTNDIILQFIKDSWGNIGGVVVGSFFYFWWVKESKFIKREIIIFSVSIGLIIYEFLQVLIPWQTFDIIDIFGTIIGGLVASIANLLILLYPRRANFNP
jgi:hypothetical protein